jgi:hypothetical protein
VSKWYPGGGLSLSAFGLMLRGDSLKTKKPVQAEPVTLSNLKKKIQRIHM